MKHGEPPLYHEEYFLRGRSFFARHMGQRLSPRLERVVANAGIASRNRVLDLGFGRGELAFYCANHGVQYIGIDFSDAAHSIAHSVTGRLSPGRQRLITLRHLDLRSITSMTKHWPRIAR